MKTMSPQTEQQVIKAARQAIDLVDDHGMTPDDALEKIARQHKFGAHLVRFTAHAYNTGRQTAQRETSDDALSKFAAFPLMDAENVIARIWPAQVKAAADRQREGVSTEYTRPPAWVEMKKAAALASTMLKEASAAPAPPAASRPTAEQTYNQHLWLKRAAAEARTQATAAYDRLLSASSTLANYFKKAAQDRVPFSQFDFAARTYFGKAGELLADWVWNRNHQEKRGSDCRWTPGTKLACFAVDNAEPWSLLRQCVALGQQVQQKRAAEAQAQEALEKHAHDELAPFVCPTQTKTSWDLANGLVTQQSYVTDNLRAFLDQVPPSPIKTAAAPTAPAAWSLLGKQAAIIEPAISGAVSQGTKGLMERAITGPDTDPAVSSELAKLESPAHDAELRRIRAQANLAELMNDDVLKGYSPDLVAHHYNEISQMAPRLADQPLALRAHLYRALQGHVEPFEAREIAQAEKSLADVNPSVPPAPAMPRKAATDLRILPDVSHSLL